ncbi:YnbE family lipoprotein [uncultured Sneathiella sp.]|uniref:YnbE family lipoprotein n=1 Tax=uncultured Sneathiella sp. TaxID=879315 RepID=UPI0030D9E096
MAKRPILVICGVMAFLFATTSCTPKVQVEAPSEPITINLNIKLDAEVRLKIEEQAKDDITNNPGIF